MIGGFSVSYRVKDGTSDEFALQKMSAAFERAGADFSQLGEFLFPELIPLFESALADQFLAEGRGPNRGKWAPLTPKYAARKRRKHGVRPLLVAEGNLMRALTDSSFGLARRTYNARQFEFGTMGVPYASFHQSGTGRMEDRPVFDFPSDFETELNRTGRRVARKVALNHLEQFATVASPEGA